MPAGSAAHINPAVMPVIIAAITVFVIISSTDRRADTGSDGATDDGAVTAGDFVTDGRAEAATNGAADRRVQRAGTAGKGVKTQQPQQQGQIVCLHGKCLLLSSRP